MLVALEIDGEINSEVEFSNPSATKSEVVYTLTVNEFVFNSSSGKDKTIHKIVSSKDNKAIYENFADTFNCLDDTHIILDVKPLDVTFGFEEINMLLDYYNNVLGVMKDFKAEGIYSIQSASDVKSVPAIEKAVVKKAITKSIKTNAKVIFEQLQLKILQQGLGKRSQWLELNLMGGTADLELNDNKGRKSMRGNVKLKGLKGKLFKPVTEELISVFNKDDDIQPIKMLIFKFEDFKGNLNSNSEEVIDISIILSRLYLKYVAVNRKGLPIVASDFQDVISNPLVELPNNDKVNQLEIKVNINKTEDIKVQLLYNDLRIIISPPVIIDLLEANDLLSSQLTTLLSKLPQKLTIEVAQPQAIQTSSKGALLTRKLQFTGKLVNIEIWVPRTVGTNQSQVCQFSFATNMNFSSDQETQGSKLVSRCMKYALEVHQLQFLVINKHLFKETESVMKASREVIIPSTRLFFEVEVIEDRSNDNRITQDNRIVTINAQIEHIRITVGFRKIVLFKSLMAYYTTDLIEALPKIKEVKEVKGEDPKETKEKRYCTDILQVSIKIESFELILSDDTELIEHELFKIALSNFLVKMSQTALLDESKRKLLERDNNFLELNGSCTLEVLFYNNTVTEYEPVVEKWNLGYEITQYSSEQGKVIKIKTKKILNFNLSHSGIFRKN